MENVRIIKKKIPADLLQYFQVKKPNRWILRNSIIWWKRNCMPSSASDRFTVDYEQVMFFTKQGKYWFEQQFEPHQECSMKARAAKLNQTTDPGAGMSAVNVQLGDEPRGDRFIPPQGRNMRCVWDVTTHGFKEAHFATFPEALPERIIKAGCPPDGITCDIFMGSGTTAVVAKKLGRQWLGIELNPAYITMSEKRIAGTAVQNTMEGI